MTNFVFKDQSQAALKQQLCSTTDCTLFYIGQRFYPYSAVSVGYSHV